MALLMVLKAWNRLKTWKTLTYYCSFGSKSQSEMYQAKYLPITENWHRLTQKQFDRNSAVASRSFSFTARFYACQIEDLTERYIKTEKRGSSMYTCTCCFMPSGLVSHIWTCPLIGVWQEIAIPSRMQLASVLRMKSVSWKCEQSMGTSIRCSMC